MLVKAWIAANDDLRVKLGGDGAVTSDVSVRIQPREALGIMAEQAKVYRQLLADWWRRARDLAAMSNDALNNNRVMRQGLEGPLGKRSCEDQEQFFPWRAVMAKPRPPEPGETRRSGWRYDQVNSAGFLDQTDHVRDREDNLAHQLQDTLGREPLSACASAADLEVQVSSLVALPGSASADWQNLRPKFEGGQDTGTTTFVALSRRPNFDVPRRRLGVFGHPD